MSGAFFLDLASKMRAPKIGFARVNPKSLKSHCTKNEVFR